MTLPTVRRRSSTVARTRSVLRETDMPIAEIVARRLGLRAEAIGYPFDASTGARRRIPPATASHCQCQHAALIIKG